MHAEIAFSAEIMERVGCSEADALRISIAVRRLNLACLNDRANKIEWLGAPPISTVELKRLLKTIKEKSK